MLSDYSTGTFGGKYTRMDQVKLVEDSLSRTASAGDITSNFLKAVFTNITWSILEYIDPFVI